MYKYPQQRKQAILRKMASPQNMTVAELAIEEGISDATLYNWRKAAQEQGAILPSNSAVPDKWSREDKFRTVAQTAAMTRAELDACRGAMLETSHTDTHTQKSVLGPARTDRQHRVPTPGRPTLANLR